jgi:hypothetical protein
MKNQSNKKTDITIILDRSGSMNSIKPSTIKGFNLFLKEQKLDPLKPSVSLVQFDDQYEMVYEGKDIKCPFKWNSCESFKNLY